MQLAQFINRPADLVQALEALGLRADNQTYAEILLEELTGMTVLVAQKFTNDRTADGLLEAFYLTLGCISLAINQAKIPDSAEAKLTFLQHHGAEYVFQMGFRQIKELSSLPYVAFVSDFDQDPFVQQRNVKALFYEICRADPNVSWSGGDTYSREWQDRLRNQSVVECAKWLRKNHFNGPIVDTDLDAHAVITLAIMFALYGDGRIVARTGQKEIESLIKRVRLNKPDVDFAWELFLSRIPEQFQALIRERMTEYQPTIIKKILSRASVKSVVTEIQDWYASSEVEIEYP
jgi:hypothetical protein